MSIEQHERAPASLMAWLEEHGVATVIVAGTDTNGLLRGKRMSVDHFARTLEHGMPLCDVFWVMDFDEQLVLRPEAHRGYFPSKGQGYPDILAVPDVSTARVVPWHDHTAIVLAEFRLLDGGEIPIDPRTVLRRVVERARSVGYEAFTGLELEFCVLRETASTLVEKRYTALEPMLPRPYTYGVYGASLYEPVMRRIRDQLALHGIPLESSNPEAGTGQIELNVRYAPTVQAADNTILYKNAIKEIFAQEGMLATFMAKPGADLGGNSGHLHFSLWREGANTFWDADSHGASRTMRQFMAGVLATMLELTALLAPTVNSYKRFVPYTWAPTTVTWGADNRSTGLRTIVEGANGTRLEHRQPGGDANPYLAAAAVLAGGLHGLQHELEPQPETNADAYLLSPEEAPRLPTTLAEALDRLEASAVARTMLGDEFIDYYVTYKRHEVDAANAAVTDWEVKRYLEML